MSHKRRDPFVRALDWVMHERDLDPKGLSQISGVKDQTIRKLLRESAGSTAMRDKIARALKFKSFADVYQFGLDMDNPMQRSDNKTETKSDGIQIIIERLNQIEARIDTDMRNLRTQIDALTRLIIDLPINRVSKNDIKSI